MKIVPASLNIYVYTFSERERKRGRIAIIDFISFSLSPLAKGAREGSKMVLRKKSVLRMSLEGYSSREKFVTFLSRAERILRSIEKLLLKARCFTE